MTQFPTGWIPEGDMTDDQCRLHRNNIAKMPMFNLVGDTPPVGTKILLTDTWKDPKVVAALGGPFKGWGQDTGSCVGVGGGNACQTLNFVESITKKQPEKIVLIAWYYNYGLSRKRAGMRGQGEGSFGSTFAESIRLDGTIDANHPGLEALPDGEDSRGMRYLGKSLEMQWSDGNHADSAVRTAAQPQTITSAPIAAFTAVRDAIANGYPVTRAGMSFANPGTASVRNGALVGSYNGRGGHQESWLGYWNHPQLGELIWEQNQWGANAYGSDPGGGVAGGCWIRADEVHKFCQASYAEVYAISSYSGYPARPEVFDWATRSLWR